MADEDKKLLRQSVGIVVKVAALFVVIVSTVMVMQYIQLKKIAPESSQMVPRLQTQLSKDPANAELRERIRDLDLLSRRAWFTGQDQLMAGGWLLLGGGGVLLLGFIILGLTADKRADKESCPGMVEPRNYALRITLGIVGGGLFISALAVAFVYDIADSGKKIPVVIPVQKVTSEEFYANWPCFRGPDGRGVAPGKQLFTDWDIPSGKNLLWKTPVPLPGFSSPIVWGNRVFVTGGNKTTREVYCFDSGNGKLLWRHAATDIPGSPETPPKVSSDTGYAASTPATDGHRVFAAFATGDLVCVDFDGKRVWAKNLGVPENPYGYSSSLLTTPDKLIMQYDDERRQLLIAFDSATGREIWRQERKAAISWASPVKIEVNGKNQIVILTCKTVECYELESGKQLWKQEIMRGEVAVSASFAGGRVLVSNDNAVTAAINPLSGEILWENEEIDMPDVSSPVAVGDLMFLFTSGGVAECIDAESGTKLWEKELDGGFYNSPLLVGDLIIVINMKGIAHIIKPDRKKFVKVAECKVGEMVVATPAPGKKRLWIRGAKSLYCVGENAK